MRLIADYPWYFTLLCIAIGLLYSGVLYSIGNRGNSLNRKTRLILSTLRFVSVTAIALLLMAPMVRRHTQRKEKPIVVIVQDNSKSLDYSDDSAYVHDTMPGALDALAESLKKEYDVQRLTYGSEVKPYDTEHGAAFDEQTTNMSMALNEVSERYYRRNVGAVLLLGDGIFNSGESPVPAAKKLNVPVYTVALGDTTVRCDASVVNLRTNKIAYVGSEFPVEATVNATNLDGRQASLVLKDNGKILASKKIAIKDNRHSATEMFQVSPDDEGVHRYEVAVEPLDGEYTTRNNVRAVSVEVLDRHRKIAIAAATPHPDVAAMRRALENIGNYDIEIVKNGKFSNSLQDYDLIVLHQYPNRTIGDNVRIHDILDAKIPLIVVVGGGTDLAQLNTLHMGLEIRSRIDRHNDATAIFNKGFTMFTIDENDAQRFSQYPPMNMPFGDYKLSGGAQVLLFAQVGNVNTGQPIIAIAQSGQQKYTFIVGDGLWRWRLSDYQANGSHATFDNLLGKLVSYTALRIDKERLHIDAKTTYNNIEQVVIEGQVFNDNFEPVNNPDLVLELRHTDSTEGWKRYSFNKNGQHYTLNLGLLPAGHYIFKAHTTIGGKILSKEGTLSVEELMLEEMSVVADHAIMGTLAAVSGGESVDARHLEDFADMLKERDDMHTVIYSDIHYSDMLALPWLLIFIVLLLSVEWIVRKYNGEI